MYLGDTAAYRLKGRFLEISFTSGFFPCSIFFQSSEYPNSAVSIILDNLRIYLKLDVLFQWDKLSEKKKKFLLILFRLNGLAVYTFRLVSILK